MKYYGLIAKTDKNDANIGLPLWMHLKDTMGIALKLVEEWVPESVLKATGMDLETFRKTTVFLAGVHDIGKATSYFQSVITKECIEQRDILARCGFEINDKYLAQGKTPHAWAGQWILQSEEMAFDVPKTIAVAVGAHHGKPYEYISVLNGCKDLLKVYPENFYGRETARGQIGKDIWTQCWEEIIQEAMLAAGFHETAEIPELTHEAQIILSGLIIVADWLASNTDFFPLIPFYDFESAGFDAYGDRVEIGWEKARFPKRWISCAYRMDSNLFRERFGFYPNNVQAQVLESVNRFKEPGIFILEAPMGSGKTEAALAAAEVIANRSECSGIFFGLPTQATSNGLFGRLYDWASQVSVETENAIRLAHGASDYNEEYMGHFFGGSSRVDEDEDNDEERETLTVHPWFQGNKRALLADFVVGTVDQFLMASLKRKHFMLRHIGLAGKVVVIDECHAYDTYMNQYLEESIQWMAAYGISVILLSATLPCDRRKKLVEKYAKAYSKYHLGKKKRDKSDDRQGWDIEEAYPLLTWTDGEKVRQEILSFPRHKTKVEVAWLSSLKEMISVLEDHLSEGGCACIIVNTVKMAQEIYRELTEQMDGYEVILYHAQFTITDRNRKEKYLMERMGKNSELKDRNRVILIGTQVLEQSLDYDADIMFTQLCPMDLLLQRMGRLHRHKDRVDRPQRVSSPKCFVLGEEEAAYDEGTEKIYGEYLLEKTKSILLHEVVLPDDISSLVQNVYREPKESDDDAFKISGYDEYARKQQNQKARAEQFLLSHNGVSGKTIENILRNQDTTDERYAESSVRDAASSIEVLLMKRGEDDKIVFVDESHGEFYIDRWAVPDFKVGKKIAQERLRLPHVFCYNERSVIDELEERNIRELSAWQECPWLQGELILLLDQEGKTELNGYILSYDGEKGLVCIRKDT